MNRKLKIALCVLASFVGLLIVLAVYMIYNPFSGYDLEKERKRVEEEQKRFEEVLQSAPDEELLLMLRFAIYRGYVPTGDPDPYENINAEIGTFHRTGRIYETLCDRNPALLHTICSDSLMLEAYVYSCNASFEPEELDTTQMNPIEKYRYLSGRDLYAIREMIMPRLAPDSLLFDSIDSSCKNELFQKYF